VTVFVDGGGFPITSSALYGDVGGLGRAVGLDLQDLAQAEVAGYDPRPFIGVAAADTSDLLASGNFGGLFVPLLPPNPSYNEVARTFAVAAPDTLQAYGIAIENYFTPVPGPAFLGSPLGLSFVLG